MNKFRKAEGGIRRHFHRGKVNRFYATAIFSLVLACLGVQTALAAPTDDFVTTWKGDPLLYPPGLAVITVPMIGGPYDVDWNNDGVFDEFNLNGSVTHVVSAAGTRTIRIRGDYDSIRFANQTGSNEILSLDQWGTQVWTTMKRAIQGAFNMTVPATDIPDFSRVTDMSEMFEGATSANPDTSDWDTSSVTDMLGVFLNATLANPDTSGWDTSQVTNMHSMFSGATTFDQDIGSWDVGSLSVAPNNVYGRLPIYLQLRRTIDRMECSTTSNRGCI
jgi:surface protein